MVNKKLTLLSTLAIASMTMTSLSPSLPLLWQDSQLTAVLAQESEDEIPGYQEDFFQAVNKEYLDSFEMAPDEISVGVNDELDANVEKELKTMLADLDSGKREAKTKEEEQLINYYRLVNDFEGRDKAGAEPLKTYFEEIEGLKDPADLTSKMSHWIESTLPLPFAVYATPGLEDPNTNELMIGSGNLILPDTAYYEEGNADGLALMDVYKESSIKLLEAMGYSHEDAEKHVQNTIDYDKLMASYRTPSEERMNTSDNIFPTSLEDAKKLTDDFGLMDAVTELVGQTPEKINVDDQKFSAGLKDMMSPDHFDQLKSWMLVNLANSATGSLSEELRLIGSEYDMAKSGAEEAKPKDKAAYEDVIYTFSDVVGNAYGEEFFGEEARQDVRDLTNDIIDMYKERLKNNEWLSEGTREKAIEKLDKMGVMVGYGDNYNKNTPDYVIDPEKSLYENVLGMAKVDQINSLKDIGQAVAEDQWEMAPFEVNAYYNPTENLICLPAGILQEPFFSENQSDSQNYGGIGNVIGHELTHAFDTSGAEFDAEGVFTNWWTDEDYKAFEDRTQKMIAQFDGYEIHGGKVDGKQTLNENVADNGGLTVALEALKRKDNPDFKEYFETYAKTWAVKLREEYAKMSLTTDEHGPVEVRVDVPVRNFDEFYEAFGIKEGDPMYMKPEDRIIFW